MWASVRLGNHVGECVTGKLFWIAHDWEVVLTSAIGISG